jgi:glycosyltransferase involved in cell wall biosynthesis
VAKYYNRCDIFILPSTSRSQEGFGMVALEALACGKPVICTRIVGVAEEVERVGAGLVVEAGKPEVLAGAIVRLLQSGPEARRMGAAGRRLVEERYGWRKVAERFEGLYEDLVGEGPPDR